MKITVTKKSELEIEVPKYFKIKDHNYHYFMCIDGERAVQVVDYNMESDSALGIFPRIEVLAIKDIYLLECGVDPISEVEFKTAFLRVNMRIEETLNN